MTIINQTNRTLLLEEINPEKLDLLTLIGDVKGIDSLSDEMCIRDRTPAGPSRGPPAHEQAP